MKKKTYFSIMFDNVWLVFNFVHYQLKLIKLYYLNISYM